MSLTRKLAEQTLQPSLSRKPTPVEVAEARWTVALAADRGELGPKLPDGPPPHPRATREHWQRLEERARAEGATEEELAAVRPTTFADDVAATE